MVYQLDKNLPLPRNISNIVTEEIQGCFTSLETLDTHEAVHDIRKRFKKLRAMARLVRDEMGEENYKEINIFFRDLGREISDLRDLTAHIETLNILEERYGKYLYVKFFNSLRSQLEKERSKMLEEFNSRNFFSDYLPAKLKTAQNNLVKWPVNSNDIQVILPGIRRVYERGQKALACAYEDQAMEKFHEWRKRVKYLWYQTLLLQETWPKFFSTLEAEIHLLADYLGDDHDLMVFQKKINSEDIYLKAPQHSELMNAIIESYSKWLRIQAKTKGELIYAESPDDFTKRIKSYTEANWN